MNSYRPLVYQVFVLRLWREGTSGTWRGQIVHLPDQETTSFANWDQAKAFIGQFVLEMGIGNLADDDGSGPPA